MHVPEEHTGSKTATQVKDHVAEMPADEHTNMN
jgi:hypothetical protein